jgi:DNA-binding transcriptional LysR family regulator
VIDLHQLRLFRLVVEHRSFSAAAQAARLTQPTVSSHISRLEASLGVALLDRLPGGVEPTGAGRILYLRSVDILTLAGQAEESVRAWAGTVTGTLNIGASTIPGEYVLPAILGEFRREAPDVRIVLRIADTREITSQVLSGSMELGLVGHLPAEPALESIPLAGDRLVVIAPPGHPLASPGRKVPWSRLRGLPFWIRESGSGSRETVREALAAAGVDPDDLRIIGELGSNESIKRAVRTGSGLGFVSSLAAADDVAGGRLSIIEAAGFDLGRSFHLIRHLSRTPSPAAALLHRRLVETIS